jgi:ADP-ribose pyrophosphatase YjhB (NUDIX family)
MKINTPTTHKDPAKPWLKSPFWVTLGGGIEQDEDIVAAARREIREETGFWDLQIGPMVWHGEQILLSENSCVHLDESFIIARTVSTHVNAELWTAAERSSILELRWWSLEELAGTSETVLPPNFAVLLKRLLEGQHDSQVLEIEL